MAIQFCCSQCDQPIEVDDQHAGQTAACPYCHHVISVPSASTYQPAQAAVGRPLGSHAAAVPPPAPFDALERESPERAALAERQRQAARWGRWSLHCAGIAVPLFLAMMIILMRIIGPQVAALSGKGPASFKEMEQIAQLPGAIWVSLGLCSALLVALVGAVLAIVSLSQSRAGNWRGWTALAVCGGMLVCICGPALLSAIMPGGLLPAG